MTTTTDNSFLPNDYEIKENGSSKYLKLLEWDTVKLRILTNSVIGWEYFKEEGWKTTPVRQKNAFNGIPSNSKDWREPKEFRAFCVYNYTIEKLQIWEITQASIKKAIFNLWKDADFWDPKGYDLKITREGKWLETKYQVVPLNKSTFSKKDILEEVQKVRVEELFEGWDPFNPLPF